MFAAGIGWFVFPVYLTSIALETGWTRTQLSIAVSVWAVAGGVFSPIAGAWIDRWGPRRVMIVATLAQVAATLGMSQMDALWQLYPVFVVSAIANAANTTIPVSVVVSQWFDAKRGAAMALAMSGMAVGGFVVPIVANRLLAEYGWRTSWAIFAVCLLALLPAIALWIRPGPGPGALGEGGDDDTAMELSTADLTAAESARTRSFWMIGIGDAMIGLIVTAVTVHMVAFTTDAGASQGTASTAYATFLAVNSVGVLLFGVAADRFPIRLMMTLAYGGTALALLPVFGIGSPLWLFAFAVTFGVFAGGRAALWPLAIGQSFGVTHLASVLGWLNIPFMLGSAIGPALAGGIYDAQQSYTTFFVISIGLSIVSAGFVSRMRNERRATPG